MFDRRFGFCLTVYQPLRAAMSACPARADGAAALEPIGLCFLSHWAFIGPFEELLWQLYRLAFAPLSVPLESVICNLMHEVPLPAPGTVIVQVRSCSATVGSLLRVRPLR